MTSWDDLDSFKLKLQPKFQPPSRPPPAWQGGFQHAHQTFTPPTQPTLSLDRYLQLLQLLCGGPPATAPENAPAANFWTVRQLGELERSAVKMEDLKKVLALNGRVISAKNKQDMLDKIAGLQLACPVFTAPAQATPLLAFENQDILLEAKNKQELQQAMQRALQWADISPSESTLATAAISRQGCYSFCPLPQITLPSSSIAEENTVIVDGEVEEGIGQVPVQQPATSATTFASRPDLLNIQIVDSSPPRSSSFPKAATAAGGGVKNGVVDDTEMHDVVYNHQNFSSSPPEWLIDGYEKLAAVCQGIKNLPTNKKNTTSSAFNTTIGMNASFENISMEYDLVGRKIALVMMDDFQQGDCDGDGDGGGKTNINDDGVIDKVSRGLHLGQVVECIGHLHDKDICPVGCTQTHNYCYVRVTPTETTAPEHRRSRRRLDLEVDLREECRLETLEDLLFVRGKELADAWVLVEPRDHEEEEEEA